MKKRNEIAKDLFTKKYRKRVVKPIKGEKNKLFTQSSTNNLNYL